jgi:hypothetical protein
MDQSISGKPEIIIFDASENLLVDAAEMTAVRAKWTPRVFIDDLERAERNIHHNVTKAVLTPLLEDRAGSSYSTEEVLSTMSSTLLIGRAIVSREATAQQFIRPGSNDILINTDSPEELSAILVGWFKTLPPFRYA